MTGHGSSTMAVAGQAFRTLSALCGIAVPFLSVLVAAGVGYLRPGYSHTEQRLSELGAAGAPHSSVFNLLGLMTSGALVVVLSAGLHAELGGNRLARIASPLLAVSGISLFMTGIFPCDVGVAEPTASGMLHGFFAAAGTLAIIGAALATGLGMMRDAVWRNYARFSLCVTAVAVALYLPYQFDLFARWEGAVQRMLVLILLVWLEVMSIKLLGRSWAKASSESDRASRGCTEC